MFFSQFLPNLKDKFSYFDFLLNSAPEFLFSSFFLFLKRLESTNL